MHLISSPLRKAPSFVLWAAMPYTFFLATHHLLVGKTADERTVKANKKVGVHTTDYGDIVLVYYPNGGVVFVFGYNIPDDDTFARHVRQLKQFKELTKNLPVLTWVSEEHVPDKSQELVTDTLDVGFAGRNLLRAVLGTLRAMFFDFAKVPHGQFPWVKITLPRRGSRVIVQATEKNIEAASYALSVAVDAADRYFRHMVWYRTTGFSPPPPGHSPICVFVDDFPSKNPDIAVLNKLFDDMQKLPAGSYVVFGGRKGMPILPGTFDKHLVVTRWPIYAEDGNFPVTARHSPRTYYELRERHFPSERNYEN